MRTHKKEKVLIKEDNQANLKLNDNFWKWFGNSKCVDEKGNPLVVYHGTSDEFQNFDRNKGSKYDSGFLGSGFYFTSSKARAKDYSEWKKGSNPHVMSCYLSIQNPIVLKRTGNGFKWDIQTFLGLKNTGYPLQTTEEESKQINQEAFKKGYDGIIAKSSYGDTVYVIFNPKQVKSVKNGGRWDGSSQNIYEAIESNKIIAYHGSSDKDLKVRENSLLFFTGNKEEALEWANRTILGNKNNKENYVYTAEITFNKPYIIGDVKANPEYEKYKDNEDAQNEIFFDDINEKKKLLSISNQIPLLPKVQVKIIY